MEAGFGGSLFQRGFSISWEVWNSSGSSSEQSLHCTPITYLNKPVFSTDD